MPVGASCHRLRYVFWHGVGRQHVDRGGSGRAGLQIITIQDDLFEEYDARTDFIQKYVFPGGSLPSEARLATST